MAERDDFERSLEDVFEDRAREFSSELRALLEMFWLEGVRQGRLLERLETHDLERALEARAPRDSAAAWFEQTITSSSGRALEGELTLEQITRAARELDRQLPSSSFGFESFEERMRLETSRRELGEFFMQTRPTSGSSHIRRELFGSWVGTDEECRRSNSPTQNSPSSRSSSIRATSRSSGIGSTSPGKSGRR